MSQNEINLEYYKSLIDKIIQNIREWKQYDLETIEVLKGLDYLKNKDIKLDFKKPTQTEFY